MLLTCAVSANAQKLDVKILDRQDKEDTYDYAAVYNNVAVGKSFKVNGATIAFTRHVGISPARYARMQMNRRHQSVPVNASNLGYAVQTLKNLKWGLSSIFVAAVKYGYMTSNPAKGTDLPPEEIKERKVLPDCGQLNQLIERLEEPISTAVWLVAVSCIRPEELAFKYLDLDAQKRELWVVRAVNRGKLHTPKYHRTNRPIRLTEADVERLLALKARMKAKDEDWVFPNRIKTGRILKPGPIWHEDLLARRIQPVARELGLPHITWRLLRYWGATQMVEARVPIKAAQERLGHSRPNILLKVYAHVLDQSADAAAETLCWAVERQFFWREDCSISWLIWANSLNGNHIGNQADLQPR